MKIDIDRITNETALIILHPTGIKYDVQVGGMQCLHPNPEGYAIGLGSFLEDFDSCEYGCQYLHQMPEKQLELANDLDVILRAETDKWTFQIRVDIERIREIEEGYFPVIVSGKIDGEPINAKGFIHNGNCD